LSTISHHCLTRIIINQFIHDESALFIMKHCGRIAFVEYRMEDPNVPIKLLHKMSQLQVMKEATPHPLEWVKTISALPRQHIVVFKKTTATPAAE